MILQVPKGGLPGLEDTEYLMARVPIYGTRDAGRQFWKRLRKVMIDAGFRENRIMIATYSYSDEKGDIKAIVGSHVDDLLWASKPEVDRMMEHVLKTFECGKIEEGNFRYCGKEIVQDDDFNITVTCKQTTLKMKPIVIKQGRKASDNLNDDEKSQMKSIAGSLSWMTRQCRPDLAYRTSKVQSMSSKGIVKDIRDANKAIDYAISTADRGLYFKAGVIDWNDMVNGCVSDASHGNESEEISGKVENHRSQGGRLQILATPSILDGEDVYFHVIGFASHILKRVLSLIHI